MLASTFVALILAFSVFIYYFNSRYAFSDFYKRLEIRAFSMAKSDLDQKSTADLIRDFKGEYLEPLHEEKHVFIELDGKNRDFKKIANENNLNEDFVREIYENGSSTYRRNKLFFSGIRYDVNNKNYLVITSAINYYYEHHMVYMRNY